MNPVILTKMATIGKGGQQISIPNVDMTSFINRRFLLAVTAANVGTEKIAPI